MLYASKSFLYYLCVFSSYFFVFKKQKILLIFCIEIFLLHLGDIKLQWNHISGAGIRREHKYKTCEHKYVLDSLGVAHKVLEVSEKALWNGKVNSSYYWIFFACGNRMFLIEMKPRNMFNTKFPKNDTHWWQFFSS